MIWPDLTYLLPSPPLPIFSPLLLSPSSHATPSYQVGGPIGLLKDGDKIVIDTPPSNATNEWLVMSWPDIPSLLTSPLLVSCYIILSGGWSHRVTQRRRQNRHRRSQQENDRRSHTRTVGEAEKRVGRPTIKSYPWYSLQIHQECVVSFIRMRDGWIE